MKLFDSDLDLLLSQVLMGTRSQLAGWGVRDVSGQYNSLTPGQAQLGAADLPFRSISGQVHLRAAEPVPLGLPPGFAPPAGTPTSYDNSGTFIVDSRPREISNLVADEVTPHFSAPQAGVLNGLPTSKLHTLFGQFFTHDMDLVPKGANGIIYMPLLPGDPLYAAGSQTNFMVLSRANYEVNVGGDRVYQNQISSWIDLGPTYGTHGVMTALLKEYDTNGVATGRMLEHTDPVLSKSGGLPQWSDVKANALRIGITLVDQDVLNLPALKLNADGTVFRNASGMAELAMANGDVVRTGHAFLDDLARGSAPKAGLLPDADTNTGGMPAAGFYDDEMLAEHFISGDGRNNENYPLTAVHGIFHAEHNRVYAQLQALVTARGPAFASQWTGDMLFEATKVVVEAEYRQIAFDEYIDRLTPNVDAYAAFANGTLGATISNEFAHAIFRFGHTQTSETSDFISTGGTLGSTPLLVTFTNPQIFATDTGALSGIGSQAYATSELSAMSRTRANEIDELFTGALRNTLLGLPLDLTAINIARGRDTGLPSLNGLRSELFAQTGLAILKPYDSWNDFSVHLLNPASLKNFIMAYAGAELAVYQSTYSAAAWANLRVTDWQTYKAALGTAATAAMADPAFMGLGGNQRFNDIDLYLGGLAEAKVPGGMLGSTFDFVTAVQMAALRDHDRFADLNRLMGSDAVYEVRATSFADLIRQNVNPISGLTRFNTLRGLVHGDAFAVADAYVEMNRAFDWQNPIAQGVVQSFISPADTRIGAGYSLNAGIFTATALSEVIAGTSGIDIVVAGLGNDTVYGEDNTDTVDGQDGNDFLYGGDGNDTLTGGSDNDVLHGDSGNDSLSGGAGADEVFGDAGDDTLAGDAGNDFVYGSDGNDTLTGGDGSDELAGGVGNDTLSGGAGQNTLDGGNGIDTAVFEGNLADYALARIDSVTHTITRTATGDVDRVTKVELLQFADITVNLTAGAVSVSDITPAQNQVLTATTTLANTSGVTITAHQWQQSDGVGGWTSIAGATAVQFTPGQAQSGRHLRVIAAFDDASSSGTLAISDPTAPVTNVNDAPSGTLTLSGLASEDQTLSANTSGITDADGLGVFSLQWLRNGVAIAGATAATYTLGDADVGSLIAVQASYTDGHGTPELVSSPSTAAVTPVNDTPQGSVTLDSAAPTVGQTLTASNTLSDPDGLGTLSWAWQSSANGLSWTNTVDIGTASLVVNAALAGLQLRAVASYVDAQGTLESVFSTPTAAVPTPAFNVINGSAGNDPLVGTAAADQINGLAGNDTLDGGAGADQLLGGAGSDRYFVDNPADGVIDIGGGWDVVSSTISYALGANIEELWLTGSAHINASGNSASNNLLGNAGNNTLWGGLGNDQLIGNLGADTLIGGPGNDAYSLDNVGDLVVELPGEGIDLVRPTLSWTLGAHQENLSLLGSAPISGTGNELDNTLTGNVGANALFGMAGSDTLIGGLGNDSLVGGSGIDTAVFSGASGASTIARTVNNTYTVTTGGEVDTLGEIEFAQFSNQTLALTTGGLSIDDTTPQTGQVLLLLSDLANTAGLTITATQWQAFNANAWVDIAGATGATFAPGPTQIGQALRVAQTFTDTLGAGQLALSAATASVVQVNSPATGAPSIAGTLTEDQTLSASTAGIADADGLEAFSYQWLRSGVDIAGATAASYTLGDADVGTLIKVRTSFTDSLGFAESLTSAATASVANVNDAPLGLPTLSGATMVGSVLSADTSAVTDADGLGPFSLQWQREGVNIAGATGSSYTTVAADSGLHIRVHASYVDFHGTAESVFSAPTPPVGSNNNPPSGLPVITGTATEDQTLGVDTSGIADVDGLGVFSHQWLRNGVSIAGATASSYTLGDADAGTLITVRTSFTDGLGFAESLTSAATATVSNVNDAPSGALTLSGLASEDQTLSANTSGITDADGLGVFSLQWLRNGVAIAGATAATYTLGDADVGSLIAVQASYTDGHGTPELVSSPSTAAVTPVNDTPQGSVTLDSAAPTVGQTLTASNTLSDPDGLGTLSWAWQSSANGLSWTNTVDIGTASLVVNAALAGLQLRAVASYVDAQGTLESVFSTPTAAVPTPAFNVINGSAGNDPLVGTAAADQINGLAGNDTLDGGAGADQLLGGAGSDRYFVDNPADGVIDIGGGWDVVSSTISYALGANIEELWLTGSAHINASGNSASNNLLGNAGNNTLWGGLGNDQLIGNLGADTLIGGPGNDAYSLDNVGDLVVELPGEGIDLVRPTLSWTLGAHQENLSLLGSAPISGTGNELDNTLTGNVGANALFGMAGSDTLIGGLGRDELTGGSGADTFRLLTTTESPAGQAARDIIMDFLSGTDRIDLTGIDADTTVLGDQAFALIGEAGAFTSAAQLAYHYEVISNTEYTVIEGNVDANLGADFQIAFLGHHTFQIGTPDLMP